MVSEKRWLVLIFSLYFLLATGYSLLMPIWEAPDEPAHYHIAWHMARFDKYPSEKLNYEAHQPRTFYRLAAWVVRGLDEINPSYTAYYFPQEYKFNIRIPERRYDWNAGNYRFLAGVYSIRWLNIIIGSLALWLTWKAFSLIAPDKPAMRLASLALAALTPQFLHIMSSVNNDALGTLAGALLFYLTIRIAAASSNAFALFSLPLALVLPFTTKLTALPVGAALLVSLAWQKIFQGRQRRWLMMIVLTGLLAGILIYLSFPETIQPAIHEITWRLVSFRKNAFTTGYLKFILSQITWTYWGQVGWLAVALPTWMINFLAGWGTIGMVLHARGLVRSKTNAPHFNLWMATWLVASLTILAVFRNGLTTSATQGRFLFPAIGALSILMIGGWHGVLPERIQRRLPLIVTIFMTICTLILWVFGVLPVYFQPFLD